MLQIMYHRTPGLQTAALLTECSDSYRPSLSFIGSVGSMRPLGQPRSWQDRAGWQGRPNSSGRLLNTAHV